MPSNKTNPPASEVRRLRSRLSISAGCIMQRNPAMTNSIQYGK